MLIVATDVISPATLPFKRNTNVAEQIVDVSPKLQVERGQTLCKWANFIVGSATKVLTVMKLTNVVP
jgi:hypothetical protein